MHNIAMSHICHVEDIIQASCGFVIRGCIVAGVNAIQTAGLLLLARIARLLQQAQHIFMSTLLYGNNGMGK